MPLWNTGRSNNARGIEWQLLPYPNYGEKYGFQDNEKEVMEAPVLQLRYRITQQHPSNHQAEHFWGACSQNVVYRFWDLAFGTKRIKVNTNTEIVLLKIIIVLPCKRHRRELKRP